MKEKASALRRWPSNGGIIVLVQTTLLKGGGDLTTIEIHSYLQIYGHLVDKKKYEHNGTIFTKEYL